MNNVGENPHNHSWEGESHKLGVGYIFNLKQNYIPSIFFDTGL